MRNNMLLCRQFLGSTWFWVGTLVVFGMQASYLAVTSRFPMAFDEAYHFGLIQFFGHHLNPIITSQGSATYKFGAIIQDPSFLYHYVLSFPYRLIELFTQNPVMQVMFLRFINVAIATTNLVVIHKLLRTIGTSKSLGNLILFVLAFTPIVSVLAAQISYFNLLILLASLTLWRILVLLKNLQQQMVDAASWIGLFCLCLFASLVAYAFLPIFLAIIVLTGHAIWLYRRQTNASFSRAFWQSFVRLGAGTKIILLVCLMITSFLFGRIYIVNTLRYHNPVPQCNQVLSITACQHYYAWDGNYRLRQQTQAHRAGQKVGIAKFSARWLLTNSTYLYGEVKPGYGLYYISIPFFVFIGLVATLAVAAGMLSQRVRYNQDLAALAVICLFYLGFLWLRNYHDYLNLGASVAVNGRYFIPVLVVIYVVAALNIRQLLAGRQLLKTMLAITVVITFLGLGGFVQYVTVITPAYGHLRASNNFVLPDASQLRLSRALSNETAPNSGR